MAVSDPGARLTEVLRGYLRRLKVFAGFERMVTGLRIRNTMNNAIRKFVEAHDRYLALDEVRTECNSPIEREQIYVELLKAYLEVQHHARRIAGLQFADGMDFNEAN